MQITAGFAEGALRLVARSGGSADRVKARAKYRAPSPAAAGLLESQEIGRLLECCAAELDDPYFGLRLGATLDLRALGTISYAIANARNVGIGLRNLIRYRSSYSRDFDCFYERNGGVVAGFRLYGESSAGLRHLGELCVAIVVHAMQTLVDDRWESAEIKFEHERYGSTSEYRKLLGCVPRFHHVRTELRIREITAGEIIPFADRVLLPVVERQLTAVVTDGPGADHLLGTTRTEIARVLCDGAPNIDEISHRLRLSSRTLQRRLRERGTSYRGLLCDVRKRLAREYLNARQVDLLEVSLLLGYSDLSAFDHAFHSWFGETPSAYRERMIE